MSPEANRPIDFYYNYKAYFRPIINKFLRNYGLPHCFKIYRVCKRAVCVHKPFSTSPDWLPVTPAYRISESEVAAMTSSGFAIQNFELFGGIETVVKSSVNDSVDGKELTQVELLNNKEIMNNMKTFNDMLKTLEDISTTAICEQEQLLEDQCQRGYQRSYDHSAVTRGDKGVEDATESSASLDDPDLRPSDIIYRDETGSYYGNRYNIEHEARVKVQREMVSRSTQTEGYIFWLDWSQLDASWYNTTPKPFYYFQEVSFIV